jgi:hypothetical protein
MDSEENSKTLHIKLYIQNKIGHVRPSCHEIEIRNIKMQNLKLVLEIRRDKNGRYNKSTPLDYV